MASTSPNGIVIEFSGPSTRLTNSIVSCLGHIELTGVRNSFVIRLIMFDEGDFSG